MASFSVMPQLMRLEAELRQRARELIRQRKLPDRAPARVWAGPGSERPCALCGDIIPGSELEYEVELGGGHTLQPLPFHFACHAAWQLECLRADFTAGAQKSNRTARPGLPRSKPEPPKNDRTALPTRRWGLLAAAR